MFTKCEVSKNAFKDVNFIGSECADTIILMYIVLRNKISIVSHYCGFEAISSTSHDVTQCYIIHFQ